MDERNDITKMSAQNTDVEETPLDRLYHTVSNKVNMGVDLDTFRKDMSTPGARRAFHDSCTKLGLNIGNYDVYEAALSDKTGLVSKIAGAAHPDFQSSDDVPRKNGLPMTGEGRTDFDRMRFDKNPIPEFKSIDPNTFVENAQNLNKEFDTLKKASQKPEKEKSFWELYGEAARNEKTMTAIPNLHESGVKDAAKMFNTATIDLYKKATSEGGAIGNLARGAGEGLGGHFVDYVKMWRDFGQNKSVLDLTNKIQGMEADFAKNATPEDDVKKQVFDRLNPDEQLLLKSLSNYYDAASALNSEVPYMRKLGEGLGQSLGYMAEFAGTGGAGWLKGALKPAVTAGLKGVAAGSGKMGMDALSKAAAMGAERISMQAGKEAVKGFVPKMVVYAKNAPILMAEAAIQSVAMPTFYKNLGDRISSGESESSAFWNTLYDNAVENYSERIFVGAGGLGRLTGSAIDFSKIKGLKGIAEIALNTGEEYAEELIGDFMKRFPDLSEKGFSQAYSDYWADKGDTFVSVALMTGLLGGASYIYNSDPATQARLKMSAQAYRSQLPLDLANSIDALSEGVDMTSTETALSIGNTIETSAQANHIDVSELYQKTQGYIGAKLRYDGFKSSLKDAENAAEVTAEEKDTSDQLEQLQQFVNKSGKIIRATHVDNSGNKKSGFVLNQTPGGVNIVEFDDGSRGVIKSQDVVIDGEYTTEEYLSLMKNQVEQVVNSDVEQVEKGTTEAPLTETTGKMMYGDKIVEVVDKVQEDGTVSVQDEEGALFAVPSTELKAVSKFNVEPSTELPVQSSSGPVPRTKDGAPDYDAMEPGMLAVELEKAMGREFTLNTLSGLIEDNNREIVKLDKKQGKSINEKIAVAKQSESLKEKNRVLREIVQEYNAKQAPVQDGTPVNSEEVGTVSTEPNQVDNDSRKNTIPQEQKIASETEREELRQQEEYIKSIAEQHAIEQDDIQANDKYGANNKIVTSERYEQLKSVMRGKLGQLNIGFDPEILAIGTEMAAYHIEAGANKFLVFSHKMVVDLGDAIRPYLRAIYEGAKHMPGMEELSKKMDSSEYVTNFDINNLNTTGNVKRSAGSIQSDREGLSDNKSVDKESVSGGRRSGKRNDRRSLDEDFGRPEGEESGAEKSGGNDLRRNNSLFGKQTNEAVYNEQSFVPERDSNARDDRGSGGNTISGLSNQRTEKTGGDPGGKVSNGKDVVALQKSIQNAEVILADENSIRKTLPVLDDEQKQDVRKAEMRFAGGSGMLFTNGTGTGKTFTGIGIVKRFLLQGRNNVLIVTPNQKIVADWIDTAQQFFGENFKQLSNTKDKGSGVNVTTYANFRLNNALLERQYDLIIYDESHYINQNESGNKTSIQKKHEQITISVQRSIDLATQEVCGVAPEQPDTNDKSILEEYKQRISDYYERKNANRDIIMTRAKEIHSGRPKIVFLSATPFAYHKSLSYGDGSLFTINESFEQREKNDVPGYNVPDRWESFMVENFGYRMRYNKLTVPENAASVSRLERMFHEKLLKEGAVSGRSINVPYDYSRDFVVVNSGIGKRIDDGISEIYKNKDLYVLGTVLAKRWTYVKKSQFLEAAKATAILPHIDELLSKGRKIVVFHNFIKENKENPLHFVKMDEVNAVPLSESKQNRLSALRQKFESEMSEMAESEIGELETLDEADSAYAIKEALGNRISEYNKAVDIWNRDYSLYANMDFSGIKSPLNTFIQKYKNRVVLFNGQVAPNKRLSGTNVFNTDNSKADIILVQRQSGKEGISFHDKTGVHPRVLINLGLPSAPTDAIQIEGRIYRIGLKSNATFEYPILNTSYERSTFAQKVATRSKTAENLALGNRARKLEEAFKDGYQNALNIEDVNIDDLGRGSKATDRFDESTSLYQDAVALYTTNLKNAKSRNNREGKDYYATPEPIGFKMVEMLQLRDNESALEPSAGHGAIARFFGDNVNSVSIEPSHELASRLNLNTTSKVIESSFESYNVINKFDGIAMNPPFGVGGKTAMDHIEKAFKHLRDGGRLVAIVPESSNVNKRLDSFLYGQNDKGQLNNPDAYLRQVVHLPSIAFTRAGTSANTKILVIDKITNKDFNDSFREVDLSGITDVYQLFTRIEDVTVLSRFHNTSNNDSVYEIVNPNSILEAPVEYTHTQSGNKLSLVKISKHIDGRTYSLINSKAREFGGYYSSYAKGFLFPETKASNEFIDAVYRSDVKFREIGNIEGANERFNEELKQQIAGELPKNHVYKLGSPSAKLLSAGIPNLPIELVASRLKEKSLQDNHPFNLSEMSNLPDAIHNPLAIFRSATHLGSFVVMTEIEHQGKNFVVAIEANRKKGRIEINDIRSIHYRTSNAHMANWVDEGLLDYVDKKRMSEWLSKQRYNSAEVKQLLGRATKIVNSFENPTILTGEISAEVDRMSDELGIEINKVKDRGQLPDEIRQRMKNGRYPGLYDVGTGKVYVIMDEIVDTGDAQATVLHEALAHKGLRGLFKKGNDLNDFLDQVMDSMPGDVRDEYLNRYKQDKYLAAEEYMASFAETYNNPSVWEKLKAIIKNVLRSLGIDLKLSDADLKYVLWKAKNGLRRGDISLETAKKISEDRRVHDVLFRNADNTQQSGQEKEWTARKFSMADLWRERMQDRMISVRQFLDEIKKRGGQIKDYMNVYIAENLASSKSAVAIEKFDKNIYEPLMNALQVFVNKGKMRAEIDNYLMAKHAPERNARLKKETGKEMNSGLTDAEASKIVEDFEKEFTLGDIAELWNRIKDATTYTVDKWYEAGFINESTRQSIKGMYKYYVPLRGFDESVETHISNRFGSSGTANLNKKAKGRESLSDSPLAYILDMAHSAIIAGNKNGIKKNLFDLMIRNPNADMYRIDKTYLVNTGTVEKPNWIGQIERPAKELFDKGFAKESGGGKIPGLFNMQSNQVDVWVNGQRYVMTIHGAIGDKVASAVNGTNSVNAEFLQKTVGRLTRWMTKNYTSRNPEFFISNFFRDFGYAVPAYWMKGGNPVILLDNMRKSFAVIHNDLMGKVADTEMQRLYAEFKENGGLTGYVHMDNIDVTKEKIERKMRKMMGERTTGDILMHNWLVTRGADTLEYCAQMSENSMRFAVYVSEIQAGKSKQEAAYAAKEITTNFNRKGTLTPVIGSLVGFFNASVQGTYNGLSLARHHPVKFATYAGSVITAQYIASQLCRAWGSDDELGDNYYDSLSDYVKYNNLILPDVFGDGDGRFFTIPLPHFFRALMSMGVVAGEVTNGVKDPGEALNAMFGNIAGELSPIDIDGFHAQEGAMKYLIAGLAPTALKPVFEAYLSNRDFMGYSVAYEPFMGQDGITPQSALAPKNTNPILVNISKFLNRIAGGDDLTSAGITFDPQTGEISRESWRNYLDINPARVEHAVEGILGGRMKFGNNVYKTVRSALDEDTDVELRNVPVARRFYTQPSGSTGWQDFYESRDHVRDINAKIKAFKSIGDWENYRKINTLENLREVTLYAAYEKMIKNLSDLEKEYGQTDKLKAKKDELALEFALHLRSMKGSRKYKKVVAE